MRAYCEHGDVIGIINRETGRGDKTIYIAWSCGDMVAVDVVVSNIGEESGTYAFDLTLDGEVVETTSDELDGGETTLVSLSVSSETEGSHEVEVNGDTDTFTVEAPTPPPRQLPWLWIDLAIVVFAVAVVYVLKKRGIIGIL